MTTEAALAMTATQGIPDHSPVAPTTDICPLAIELGLGFADPTLAAFKPSLIGAVSQVRQTLSSDLGFAIPSIAIDTVADGSPLQYRVLIRGVAVAAATVYPSQILAINTGSVITPIGGTPAVDPVFGNPAVWIDPSWAPQAAACGYAVVDPSLVIATHLGEIVRQYAAELLDWDTVQTMIDRLSPTYRTLVPTVFDLGEIHGLLCDLIDEGVNIRDLSAILEGAWQARKSGKESGAMLEQVRTRLALSISAKYRTEDGTIHAITLSSSTESMLNEKLLGLGESLTLHEQQNLVQTIRTRLQSQQSKGHNPVLICGPELRTSLRQVLARELGELAVLSTNEIARGITVSIEDSIDALAA